MTVYCLTDQLLILELEVMSFHIFSRCQIFMTNCFNHSGWWSQAPYLASSVRETHSYGYISILGGGNFDTPSLWTPHTHIGSVSSAVKKTNKSTSQGCGKMKYRWETHCEQGNAIQCGLLVVVRSVLASSRPSPDLSHFCLMTHF